MTKIVGPVLSTWMHRTLPSSEGHYHCYSQARWDSRPGGSVFLLSVLIQLLILILIPPSISYPYPQSPHHNLLPQSPLKLITR